MNVKCWQRNLFCGVLSTGLAISSYGCGGGNSSAANPPPAAAAPAPANPEPTAVTSSGVISGFGSVFVNGVKHEVESDTVVAIEDEAESVGDDSALRIGMKVRIRAVEGEDGVRVAERIEFDEDLKGPARDVSPDPDDPRLGTFVSIGQIVVVDARTVFDDDVGDNNGDGSIPLLIHH